VGNKADLPSRAVDSDDGQRQAEKMGVEYIETSAKTGEHIDHAFEAITRAAMLPAQRDEGRTVRVNDHQPATSRRRGCC
jgi:hypothetical protein